jgi:hypothetical protein
MINTNDTTISAFARLLATENIVVRHSNDAHTASFDMVERILTLPRWKGMTPALYDMLVGHEVAHALWTDATIDEATGNLAACVDIAPDNPRAALSILNIVEDARIERLIKSKYPGLKRDFVSGYKTIHEMGIFELEGRPVDKMSFLDRLNMEFKLGILGYLNVPFTDSTEIWFRDRIAASQTWDDVVEITRDLYEYDKQKQEEEEEEDQENQTDSNQQVSGMPSGAEEVDDDDSEEGSSQSNGTDGEGDDSAESSASPGDDDSDGGATSKGATASEYTPDVSTQDAMDDALVAEKSEWMPRDKGIERMPTPILKEMIVSPERIRELHIKARYQYGTNNPAEIERRLKTIAQQFAKCDEYMLNEKSSVNYLSKQFEMRKAADIHKRTMTSKTGRLDPVRMINYRWSEDIFAKNQTVRDGKNHGFVCVLDWSGSMCNNLLPTVRQAITLAMFCRRTGLPFELYAFSDRLTWDPATGNATTPETWSQENYNIGKTTDGAPWKTSNLNELQMLNFLSAKMNTREFTEACRVLYSVAMCEGNCQESRAHDTWTASELQLGGTPLDESLVALHTMLPAFQRKHNVQVLNAVILTDGDGRNTFDNAIIINPITKRSYGSHPTETGLRSTYLLLKSLKETTGCNLIGMYLSTANKCINVSAGWFDRWEATEEEIKLVQKQWKQSNYYVATGKYADFFDEAYIINANTNPETEINLPDSATQANLRNAFVKGMKSRGMSRNLSNRFIEVVAR